MRGLSFMLAVLAVVAGAASRIHSQGADHPFAGSWTANMQKSKLSPSFDAASITLRIDLAGDSRTMASRLVSSTGREQRAAETFRTDGTVTPGTLSPNVTLVARWLDLEKLRHNRADDRLRTQQVVRMIVSWRSRSES